MNRDPEIRKYVQVLKVTDTIWEKEMSHGCKEHYALVSHRTRLISSFRRFMAHHGVREYTFTGVQAPRERRQG